MDLTEGLVCGQPVSYLGGPIPSWSQDFGTDPIDERGSIVTKIRYAIHREAPSFVDQGSGAEILITGIKVVDLFAPQARGGQIGFFVEFKDSFLNHSLWMKSSQEERVNLYQLNDTIAGFRALLDGEGDEYPENAFYMQGTFEDIIEEAKRIAAETTK